MAKGRLQQLRLHAVNQAALVWAVTNKLAPEQLSRFVQTGQMDETEEVIRASPAAMAQMFESMQRRIDGQQG